MGNVCKEKVRNWKKWAYTLPGQSFPIQCAANIWEILANLRDIGDAQKWPKFRYSHGLGLGFAAGWLGFVAHLLSGNLDRTLGSKNESWDDPLQGWGHHKHLIVKDYFLITPSPLPH